MANTAGKDGSDRLGLEDRPPVGQKLESGDVIMILESMKMEIPVIAEDGGMLLELRVTEGVPVTESQIVAVVEE